MGGRDGGEQRISSYLVQLRAESQEKKMIFPLRWIHLGIHKWVKIYLRYLTSDNLNIQVCAVQGA